MFTFYGTFERQKKNKKKQYARLKFTLDEFYLDMNDTESAGQAKGFILVDKQRQTTSVYLDINGNGKLNKKKDLLIGSEDFVKSLYKAKRGNLHGTNNDRAMRNAQNELYGEDGDFEIGNGFIFSNNKGRTVDTILLDEPRALVCMMDPRIVDDEFRNNCNAEYGMELF